MARSQIPKLGHIPLRNKDLVMLYPDDHGSPRLRAEHGVWGDGVPVRELKIQKAAPIVP